MYLIRLVLRMLCSYVCHIQTNHLVILMHLRIIYIGNVKSSVYNMLDLLGLEIKITLHISAAMIECCVKLGHDLPIIQTAIEMNGGPFERIRDLLDAVYKIEEEEIPIDVVRMPLFMYTVYF